MPRRNEGHCEVRDKSNGESNEWATGSWSVRVAASACGDVGGVSKGLLAH